MHVLWSHVQYANLLSWDGMHLEKALQLGWFSAKAPPFLWWRE